MARGNGWHNCTVRAFAHCAIKRGARTQAKAIEGQVGGRETGRSRRNMRHVCCFSSARTVPGLHKSAAGFRHTAMSPINRIYE